MKMNVTGIVAEYNPFHNGHAYQIMEARKLTDCDYCVAVISGDFVQRGEVSVFSKYLRTKMALLSGADLVLEIPSIFAVSSAEDFEKAFGRKADKKRKLYNGRLKCDLYFFQRG